MKSLLFRFGIAGALATMVAYASFPLLWRGFDLVAEFVPQQLIISLASYKFRLIFGLSVLINVSISFLLQKHAVFRSDGSFVMEYLRFCVGALPISAAGYIALRYMLENLGLAPGASNAIVVSISSAASFLYHYMVTFRVRA